MATGSGRKHLFLSDQIFLCRIFSEQYWDTARWFGHTWWFCPCLYGLTASLWPKSGSHREITGKTKTKVYGNYHWHQKPPPKSITSYTMMCPAEDILTGTSLMKKISESEDLPPAVQWKRRSYLSGGDWVENWASSMPFNIHVISCSLVTMKLLLYTTNTVQ